MVSFKLKVCSPKNLNSKACKELSGESVVKSVEKIAKIVITGRAK